MKRYLIVATLALVSAHLPLIAQPVSSPATSFVVQQPAGEWLSSLFIGQTVTNSAGETLGDINDLLFDKTGRVTAVVLGIGGFIGIGDKSVGVPFSALSFSTNPEGLRVVTVPLDKQALQSAPVFKATEKSTYTKIKDKAGELKDQAIKKIEDMKTDEPKSK